MISSRRTPGRLLRFVITIDMSFASCIGNKSDSEVLTELSYNSVISVLTIKVEISTGQLRGVDTEPLSVMEN